MQQPRRPIVWTIAGSDSGGGAGIQADLLTFADLGCHGCTAITANTAQNTTGVASINAVPVEVLIDQLNALQRDLLPDAIKIGLLANSEQVLAVTEFLHRLKAIRSVPVIYDPVAVASSGDTLTEDGIGELVLRELFPLCDLVTPNLHELEWLARAPVGCATQIQNAAQLLHTSGCRALLVTGGHSEINPGEIADLLWDGVRGDWFIGDRVDSENTHGTGCTLSSAIAAFTALGYPLRDACVVAKAYVQRGLRLGQGDSIGAGPGPVGHCGWPDELQDFPRVLLPQEEHARHYDYFDADGNSLFACDFPDTDTNELGLYPVVDSVEWLERLAAEGVKTLQLRIKDAGTDLRTRVERAVAIGRQYKLRLFINDHWRLAIECGAYGVHLGQEDLRSADLKAIKSAGLKLGISTHGFYELLRAWRYRPSYLAIGAIFATGTKDMRGQLQGIDKLARMAALLPYFPLVAIGGISVERAPAVVATGVGSVAVVSAITGAADYRGAVAKLQSICDH
ncbi:thiamine phosphate synthase [Microbulbifer yueqingensis]|uniref:Thiamine-phosphate synthase n=1 Tax=Microbulbifer yueqingensis TaxID=658219 RepID=A0A1G8UPE2_9GAMM|nr:thiamine phosphate synthase [Microbulbifer yueqingensis]SDJ55712.1 thiamine-phosphate diphosphorylase [Microbulbifer yueqingensis]